MAIHLTAKGPSEVIRYAWQPPLADGDGVASFTLTATGCTIDSSEDNGSEVVFFVSGGTAAATASIVATVVTNDGETVSETLYIPIIASAAQIADTARDYCNFALRKITGNGVAPDSSELDDALERLNALVAAWRAGGADIGAAFPITASTVIYCPDWAVSALRFNLRVACHDHYDAPITAYDASEARRGLQLVKHKSLPDERTGAEFY